ISVHNKGPGTTSGTVTVADSLPTGMVATAMAGEGWSCTFASLTCTRSDSLAAGQSYAPITLTVTLTASNPGTVANMASVADGGAVGASAEDSTILTASVHPAFFAGELAAGNGVYSLRFPNGNLFGYYSYLSGGWIYHFDAGYLAVTPGSGADAYFWDLA